MGIAGFVISVFAVVLAGVSLGWNIYRDIIIKPRLKVDLSFATMIHHRDGGNPSVITNKREISGSNPFVLLEAVNHGPGAIRCTTIMATKRRGLWGHQLAFLRHDVHHEASVELPAPIEVGQPLRLAIPLRSDCFLGENLDRIGIKDSYDRIHWAPRKTLRKMAAVFLEESRNA